MSDNVWAGIVLVPFAATPTIPFDWETQEKLIPDVGPEMKTGCELCPEQITWVDGEN